MANVPGTSGPVDYPNRPEGDGGNMGGPALPGGSARAPEAAPDSPGPQQGAGVPSQGGLTPNPGEAADGSPVTGWKGSAYADAAPPNVEAVDGLDVGQQVSGEPGAGGATFGVPSAFPSSSTLD